MRPPKTITVCALALILFQTTACYSFRPLRGELPSSPAAGSEVRRTILVEKNDGEYVQLSRAWMDSTNVGGIWLSQEEDNVEIPLAEVRSVDEKYFSLGRTVVPFLVVGGLYLGVCALLIADFGSG